MARFVGQLQKTVPESALSLRSSDAFQPAHRIRRDTRLMEME